MRGKEFKSGGVAFVVRMFAVVSGRAFRSVGWSLLLGGPAFCD